MLTPRIILASSSPRRKELLAGLGLEFEVVPAAIDETPRPGESPVGLVERLSRSKAQTLAPRFPEALIIAADTTVVLAGAILEKPKDLAENRQFIERLSGHSHQVLTGHALGYQGRLEGLVKETKVQFRALSKAEIDWYVATGEGLDKAGGYAIQGRGAALIPHIEGCYFNVMGMSIVAVVELSQRLGVALV